MPLEIGNGAGFPKLLFFKGFSFYFLSHFFDVQAFKVGLACPSFRYEADTMIWRGAS
jgi:hypothetical protein